ncbi:MAG: hypothetical protein Q7R83_02775 [bacterium]|nr:hypothetical protein [bacterium]
MKVYDRTLRRFELLTVAMLRPGERLGKPLGSSFGKGAEPPPFEELWDARAGEGSIEEVANKLVALGVPADDALRAISRGEILSEGVETSQITLNVNSRLPASPAVIAELLEKNKGHFLFVDIASARAWLDTRQKPSA